MNRMTTRVVKATFADACGMQTLRPDGGHSRTIARQCLLETVLPVVALLSMSALTVVTIVVLVTTVANAGWLAPGTYVNVDPWSGLYPDSTAPGEESSQWPGSSVPAELETGRVSLGPQEGADSGYRTDRMPE